MRPARPAILSDMTSKSPGSVREHRRRLNQRLRAEWVAGAEEEWRKQTGRPMTAEELERVLRRYPGEESERFQVGARQQLSSWLEVDVPKQISFYPPAPTAMIAAREIELGALRSDDPRRGRAAQPDGCMTTTGRTRR
jgi:hypothetical protein